MGKKGKQNTEGNFVISLLLGIVLGIIISLVLLESYYAPIQQYAALIGIGVVILVCCIANLILNKISSMSKSDKQTHVRVAVILGIVVLVALIIFSPNSVWSGNDSVIYFIFLPAFLFILINVILNRIRDYNYRFSLAAMLVYLTVFFLILLNPPSRGNPLGTSCLSNKNFTCYYVNYQPSTQNVTLTLSQDTGSNWTNVEISYQDITVPLNASGIPAIWNYTNVTYVGSLLSDQKIQTNIRLNRISDGYYTGYVWMRYEIGSNTTQYSKVAQLIVQANKGNCILFWC